MQTLSRVNLTGRLRAYLALRRERHDRDLADAFRARRESARVKAAWAAEACDPEAIRLAHAMAVVGHD